VDALQAASYRLPGNTARRWAVCVAGRGRLVALFPSTGLCGLSKSFLTRSMFGKLVYNGC
jgi:hypothetical protein